MKRVVVSLLYLLSICHAISCSAEERTIPLHEVHQIADGLNVEGGTPALSIPEGSLWSNICFVLDRPLINGIDLSHLTETNPFPLKEGSIVDYNESKVHYATILMIHYYLLHAHELLGKTNDQPVQITIHVHRNSSGFKHIKILIELLSDCYPALVKQVYVDENLPSKKIVSFYYPDQNIILHYRFGNQVEDITLYPKQDIVLSIGLISGFHKDWSAGSLCIPTTFIPYTIEKNEVYVGRKYEVHNHLLSILPDMVDNQDENTVQLFNELFRSPNPEKKENKANWLKLSDFMVATLLQSDQYFYPNSQGIDSVKIIENENADWQNIAEAVRMQSWHPLKTEPCLLPVPAGE